MIKIINKFAEIYIAPFLSKYGLSLAIIPVIIYFVKSSDDAYKYSYLSILYVRHLYSFTINILFALLVMDLAIKSFIYQSKFLFYFSIFLTLIIGWFMYSFHTSVF